MAKYYRNKAGSSALTARATGGATLTIQSADASEFGSPSPSAPMNIAVFDSTGETFRGFLLATARSGNVLTVSVPPGHSDFAVSIGDKVGNVILAEDLNALWSEVDGKEDSLPSGGTNGQFLAYDKTWKTPPAPDLSGYATTTTTAGLDSRLDALEAADFATSSELASGLATKENSLPTGGTTSNFLRGDKTWAAPPASGGSVTSVGLSMPAGFSVGSTPVTTSGTLSVTTTLNGIVKGTGSGLAVATPGTDYLTPSALSSYATTAVTNGLDDRIELLENADFATSTELASGLAGKASTTAVDGLDARIDVLEAAPKALIPIVRWVVASTGDLEAGTITERADFPVDFTPVAVTANAQTNPSGGGFSFNLTVGGGDLFSSDKNHPANSTASAAYNSGFATSTVAALSQIGLEIVSAGSGVRDVVLTLFGREA